MSEHMNTPWTYNDGPGRIEGQHPHPKMGTVHIADVRGWGYLTGLSAGYGLGLGEEEALEVQRRRGELLAAAPDLLATLKDVRSHMLLSPDYCDNLDCDKERCKMQRLVIAAIARAEGEAE